MDKKINLLLEDRDFELLKIWWNAYVRQSNKDQMLQIVSIPVFNKDKGGYTCCCLHGCPYADVVITKEEIISCQDGRNYIAPDYTINSYPIICRKLYLMIKYWHETGALIDNNGKKMFEDFISPE